MFDTCCFRFFSNALTPRPTRGLGIRCGVLGKTALCEFLMGKTWLHERVRPSVRRFKIRQFLYIKHLHTAYLADAANLRGG